MDNIEDLELQLNTFKQKIIMTPVEGDPEETTRREELAGYARRLLIVSALVDCCHRTLEGIEKESHELLAKGRVARFIDKGKDSGRVVKFIDRFREAIVHYQVSGSCIVLSCRV